MRNKKQHAGLESFKKQMNKLLCDGDNGVVASICQSLLGKNGKQQDALCHFFLAAALQNVGTWEQAAAHRKKALLLNSRLASEKPSQKRQGWNLSRGPQVEDPMLELDGS
jgi:hypothetical protein